MKNEELRRNQPVRGRSSSSFFILHSSFIRLQLLRFLGLLARPFARRPAEPPGAILYIKPDHLGDLLLATPALAALRLRFPAARIAAIVGPWSALALQNNPDIDDLLVCPFPGFERRPTTDDRRPTINPSGGPSVGALQSLRRLASVVRPYLMLLRYAMLLRAGRYDLAIVGRDDHWWGAALALLAGVPRRVGFAVPECRPFLTDALPWNPRDHVTAQGLALVEAAGRPRTTDRRLPTTRTTDYRPIIQHATCDTRQDAQFSILNSQFHTRFDPSHDDLAWAGGWLTAQGIGAADQLVVLHPGTGGPAKLWRAERWATVADALIGAGARLLLTGGPGEEPLVEEVAARMRTRPPTLAGQTTVGQLAALLRRAALALGVDSGPLHLAAAQGVPTVHLYGPGDAGRFGPWGDPARHIVVRVELWCSPCGMFGACPRGLARPECMGLIDTAAVIAQARRLLETEDRGSRIEDRG
jgi:ADP-heptose:LPS heptosyltransferase